MMESSEVNFNMGQITKIYDYKLLGNVRVFSTVPGFEHGSQFYYFLCLTVKHLALLPVYQKQNKAHSFKRARVKIVILCNFVL